MQLSRIHTLTIVKPTTIATFSGAKTLTFSTMIKKIRLYKIIVDRNYKKLEHLN